MPAPLSRNLRDWIVRAVEGGSSVQQAALRYEVSPSAAVKLIGPTLADVLRDEGFQVTGPLTN